MRNFALFFAATAALACLSTYGAIDLKESKFTQVVNDVQIISTADNSKHSAAVDGLFQMPDVLRTGPASRAELVAADNTITRVGANTIFSFDAANRSIHLEQGSLLFNSPKGKGGGSIHTAAATAAVLGTTIIVVTTPDGGFKILTLEGTAEVKFLKGLTQRIESGHLIYVLPGGIPGPVVAFRLDSQIAGSKLVSGFGKPLPSLGKIQAQITKQIHQIASGRATDTGLYAGNHATATTMQVINPVAWVNGNPDAPHTIGDIVSNPGGTQSGNSGSGGGTTTGSGGTPVPPPPGVPTAPSGTIVQQSGGGYLTPDGFVFTSFVDPDTGMGAAPTYAAGPATATLTDATVSGSTLDSSRVFTSAITVTIPAQSDFNGTAESAFYSRNLSIVTPSLNFSAYNDLNSANFVVFSSENMNIANSLTLSPFATELIFFSGATLTIAPNVTISGNSFGLEFGGRNALNLTGVTFVNTGGDFSLDSFGSISLNNVSITTSDSQGLNGSADASIGGDSSTTSGSSITLNNTTVTGDTVSMFSPGSLTLTASTPGAGQLSGPSGVSLSAEGDLTVGVNLASEGQDGNINLESETGSITVNNNAQLAAPNININSGNNVLIDTIAPPSANFISVTAVNTATIQNSDVSSVGDLNVNARTVVLANVALPSSGNTVFTVANGALAANPNTGASVIPGDLNFIRNVTYHGALANTPGIGFTVTGP